MTAPVVTLRVDWEKSGSFGLTPYGTVTPLLDDYAIARNRGASADFSGAQIGSLEFVLDNDNDAYTPDRQWCDNPSFEVNTSGWAITALTTLLAAATSITRVADSARGTGSFAAEIVLPATLHAGAFYSIPYPVRSGLSYSLEIPVKLMSGSSGVEIGVASSGTPANIATGAGTVTGAWVTYTATFTATADRSDIVLFVRTTGAAAATVRIDALQFNPGATAHAFLEAPSKGQLVTGRPVHMYATSSGVDTAMFYGFVEQITPSPGDGNRTVTMTVFDMFRKLSELDVAVPASDVSRSAREMRIAVLEDAERGDLNYFANPEFASNTNGWTPAGAGSSITRVTTDGPLTLSTSADWVTGTSTRTLTVSPQLLGFGVSGQPFTAALYMKRSAGAVNVTMSLVRGATTLHTKTVTLTTSFARYYITGELDADWAPATSTLALQLTVSSNVTIRLGAASWNRGPVAEAYANPGTGRWANMIGNGSFDGQADGVTPAGWYDAFTNLVTNGSLETDLSGWSTTLDSFHGAPTSFTRVASGGYFGSSRGDIVTSAGGQGVHFAITPTLKSGRTYDVGIVIKKSTTTANATFGVGSNGTPANKGETTVGITTAYQVLTTTFVPSANRTDGHFYVFFDAAGTYSIDGAYVFLRDSNASTSPTFVSTGPGGGGTPGTPVAIQVDDSTGIYGSKSLQITAAATANSGAYYDLSQDGVTVVGGHAYNLQVTITNGIAYKIGISADALDGTYDEASASGTSSGTTVVNVPWTPSADRTASQLGRIVVFVYHTPASSSTFRIDGIRLIPQATADVVEMAQWALAVGAEGSDVYLASATLSGTALAALSRLNELTLTRMWIRYLMAAPYWQLVTEDRDTFESKAVDTTFTETVEIMDGFDLVRKSIVNLVHALWSGGDDWYSDSDSIGALDPAAAKVIDGSGFFPDRTIADDVAASFLARYADGAVRPTMSLEQQFDTQLATELEDLFDVTIARFLLYRSLWVVQNEVLTISSGGFEWLSAYTVEGYPF